MCTRITLAKVRVLVTGATGFVGSHVVAALRAAGHDLRVLVRATSRVPGTLASADVRVGDVTDADSVRGALEGCDAVVHAAAVYSFDARARETIDRVNVRATELVLGEAHRLGLDPIVYVSSTLALDLGARRLTADTAPGSFAARYVRSKADAERVARGLQEEGAPVTIVYPSLILGPDSPTFGVPQATVTDLLRRRIPLVPPGSIEIVDVRDVASAIERAMAPGRGARRYLLAGESVTFRDLVERLERLTGRRLRHVTMPRRIAFAAGRLADLAQRVSPVRLPANYEGIYVMSFAARSDTTPAREDLGFAPRDLDETLAETVRSLLAEGHIRARHAGALAAPASATRAPAGT
jgi:nucleoside-diphosphate-sugar epimerase